MAARQTLTLFVRVQILLPQPKIRKDHPCVVFFDFKLRYLVNFNFDAKTACGFG